MTRPTPPARRAFLIGLASAAALATIAPVLVAASEALAATKPPSCPVCGFPLGRNGCSYCGKKNVETSPSTPEPLA